MTQTPTPSTPPAGSSAPSTPPADLSAPDTRTADAPATDGADRQAELADCVLCGEPTEYPAATRGSTLCPVCEWQEAQRNACSG